MNKALTTPDENRLKRLIFRSRHRGCKETDLLLADFARTQLPGLGAEALDAYEAFLDEDDAHIWDWLTEKALPPRVDYLPIIEWLRTCRS